MENASSSDIQSPEVDPERAATAKVTEQLEQARELFSQKDFEGCLTICRSLLENKKLSIRSATTLCILLRELGQDEPAKHLRELILQGVRQSMDIMQDKLEFLLPASEALVELEAYEEAEDLGRRALKIAPNDHRVVVSMIAYLTQKDRADEAYVITTEYCDRADNNFETLLYFSTVFARFEALDAANMLLEKAAKKCKTSQQRTKLDFYRAANGSATAELDQHGLTVELFDRFAEDYDKQLSNLQNNGPSLIYTMLEELKLPKTHTRRILDAGCGTGLCAGFLRDYGKEVVGVDLSIKMLEKSKAKRVYDTLARTDLSVAATFPEGTFDMIVCADVLVYFGALDTVLSNFRNVLNPGGWLIFTVEDEIDETVKTGFKLYPTGRYRHSDAYLLETLKKVGFPKPKLLEHGRLRNELMNPVLGTVLAVQKPALFMS